MTNEQSVHERNSRAHVRRSFGRTLLTMVGAVGMTLGVLGTGVASASRLNTVTLGASANGHVVTVNKGEHITVDLANATWKFSTAGNLKALQLVSLSIAKPGATSGATHICLPSNCGDVFAHYFALEPGLIRLIAERTGTGSALVHWTVVIRVR
jgi:hypothetical protein